MTHRCLILVSGSNRLRTTIVPASYPDNGREANLQVTRPADRTGRRADKAQTERGSGDATCQVANGVNFTFTANRLRFKRCAAAYTKQKETAPANKQRPELASYSFCMSRRHKVDMDFQPDISDEELMNLITRRDTATFEHLYDRYAPVILGTVVEIVQNRAEEEICRKRLRVWNQAEAFDAEKGAFQARCGSYRAPSGARPVTPAHCAAAGGAQ